MFRALIVSALCSIALTTSAVAQTAEWGQVGGWKIRVDRTLGNGGCFAFQSYEDGSVIRLGFNPERKTIYFLLGNGPLPASLFVSRLCFHVSNDAGRIAHCAGPRFAYLTQKLDLGSGRYPAYPFVRLNRHHTS
jgi:hypothetical protein